MKNASLHQRIHRAAERRPDAPAVVASDDTLTYADLEERSGRLAGALRSSGCAPSDRVAILMPCSPEAVVAELGILRAGCAYVPVDLDAPVTRTAEVLRRAEPAALLVGDCPAGLLDGLRTRRLLADPVVGWLRSDEPPLDVAFTAADLDTAPAATTEPRRQADDLAYILFTSDRRGRPTGVPVTHESGGEFVDWAVDHFDLAPSDRVFGHPPSALHLSAFDTFATLTAGAEIHQSSGRGLIHPHHDPAFLEARRITVWLSLPRRLSHVARFDGLDGRDLSSLRHLAWCGDALRTSALSYWKERLPGTTLTSLYGPTESVVACGHHRIPDDVDPAASVTPIGRPRPGQEILLLDDHLRPVQDGRIGRVHLAGAGLCSEYWREPERTRRKFLPHPHSDNGARILRTSDLARRDEDGVLHLVGRGGSLIETGRGRVGPTAVEQAVMAVDGVLDCAVVSVSAGEASVKIGCAYIPENGRPLRTDDLDASVARRLPAHMVPELWLVVEDLPVDDRGRIDRHLLRKMFGGETTVDSVRTRGHHATSRAGASLRGA